MYYYFKCVNKTEWELVLSSSQNEVNTIPLKEGEQLLFLQVTKADKKWGILFMNVAGRPQVAELVSKFVPEGLKVWELVLGS